MASPPASVICKQCRLEYPGDALFCPNCGTARLRDESGDPIVGTTVGDRYLLIERLGHGASGTIYKAEHVTLRRKVAVKVLHHELSRDDLAIERFRREATTVGEIDNDHIVEILDFGRTGDGRLYMAMELLEGETLAEVFDREGQLPVDRAVEILIQLGEALMEAHAMGYVHRDLRPRNVFLAIRRGKGGKPFVKLLDFGLAKLVEKEGEAASTSLGMTFGDPHYMSPEQARGDSIDRRADIYSLGCIAYQMLIGEPPFTGGKVFDILTRHVDGTPEEAAARRPDLPAWLNRAVMRMLAKRPDERFITVYRLVEALRQGADSGLIMPDEIARREETSPPPSVSLAMAKLGQRAASEEPVVEPATSQVDTHRVGSSDVISSQPAPLAAKVAEAGGIGGRTALGVGLAGGLAAAVARGGAAAPAGQQSAFGKQLNRGNAPVTGPASGLSAAWFADGDAMEDGSDLDESVRRRLERARSHVPSGTGIMAAEVDRGASRRRWGLAAIIGVVVVGGAIAAVAMTGGGDEEKASPAAAVENNAPEAKAVTPPAPAPAAVEPTPPAPEPTPPAVETTPPAPEPTPPPPERDKERVVIAAKSAPAGKKKKVASAGSGGGRFESIGADPPDDQPAEPAPKVAADSGKADFYAKMGERDLQNGDLLGAATNFNKARELDASNATAVMGLGEVALSQGSTSAAIAHLKKATKLRSGSSRAHALLGEAYLAAGQKSAAASSFKKALKIDPDNARARDGYNEASGANDPDPGQLE